MAWYYLDQNRSQVQIEKEGLKKLLEAGAITKDTLVWNEALTDWLPLSKALPDLVGGGPALPAATNKPTLPKVNLPSASASPGNPYASPTVSQTEGGGLVDVREVTAVIGQNTGWLKFLGVMLIVMGVFYLLAFFLGAVFIWAGIVLLQAADSFKAAYQTGSAFSLSDALSKTSLHFKILAIVSLISLIFMGLFFLLGIAGAIAGAASGSGSAPGTF